MRTAAIVLACGAASAGILFVALRLADPKTNGPPDQWIEGFRAEGLQARLLSTSQEPRKDFLILEKRDKLKGRAFDGTEIYDYVIEDVTVQVASFPPAAELEEVFAEGIHTDWSPKNSRRVYHARRIGRHLLVMEAVTRPPDRRPLPDGLMGRIMKGFRDAVPER